MPWPVCACGFDRVGAVHNSHTPPNTVTPIVGVVAAVAARRLLGPHSTVEVIEPWAHIGGMLAAGMVDDSTSGNTRAYSGLALEYAHRMARAYNVTSATAACFHGEPHIVEQVLRQWLTEEGVALTVGEAVAEASLDSNRSTIVGISLMPSGRTINATQYIDATYEGDLLAAAGIPTATGRESSTRWNESFAGQRLCAPGWQHFTSPVNATASSGGLLPGVDGTYPAPWDQQAASLRSDARIQSFNFRACLTKAIDGVPIAKPASYDPNAYEIAVRYIASLNASDDSSSELSVGSFFGCNLYAGSKCDTNDGPAWGINPMGNETYSWPDASTAERAVLRQHFVNYTLGLWWFLGHDDRVPRNVRHHHRHCHLPSSPPPCPLPRCSRARVKPDVRHQFASRVCGGIQQNVSVWPTSTLCRCKVRC
jgi:hypothetical protein